MSTTGMLLDGVFASEAIDSSGEVLSIDGMDISDFEDGKGIANYEHRGDDAPGASALDVVGKVVFARKIFDLKDCDNERQRMYWRKVNEIPFLYGVVRLYDGAGHEGAKAIAAQVRDHEANNEPVLVRFSIEGSTLEKEGIHLKRSVARRVALTLKPCNRTCDSGVLADPNAPAGFIKEPKEDILADMAAQKHEHPGYARLGGSVEIECTPLVKEEGLERLRAAIKAKMLVKALEAGNYNVAPGARVGGAALQREELSTRAVLLNHAKAALREYGHRIHTYNKEHFKGFVKNFFQKHQLPEADPSFIDRFADLVDDYRVRGLTKKEAKAPTKKPSPKSKQQGLPGIADDALTIRGVPVKPNEGTKGVKFDEKKGVLHTPEGSFPVYIPQGPELKSFQDIFTDPHTEEYHGHAMENWARANKMLKEGRTPPEMVMHAALFSMLSPNTPVPAQELMYSHLVDAMKAKGMDPRQPGAMEYQSVPSRDNPKLRVRVKGSGGPLGEEWMNRDQPQGLPEHSRAYFENRPGDIRLKNDSREGTTGRKAGDLYAFMLANDKLKNMAQYHRLHGNLMDLVGRHKEDARSAVSELMAHKVKENLFDAKAKRHAAKGVDIGPYQGVEVPGLAPKTSRYMLGMLGAGNVHVPDTHFVRYLFGLDAKRDQGTIEHLKQALWSHRSGHVLDAIDRFYAKNHPAVQGMLHHPVYGKMFKNPEEAIFPAFWRNWIAIAPHERTRGMPSADAYNEGTTHEPFWAGVRPFMKHEADYDLPWKTAIIHKRWADQYGEMPALQMYYEQLMPKLEAQAARREAPANVRKMEALTIELSKAASDPWWWQGATGDGADTSQKPKPIEPESEYESVGKLDSKTHGLHLHSPEQHDLLNGIDLGTSEPRPEHAGAYLGLMDKLSRWVKTGRGTLGYMKAAMPDRKAHEWDVGDWSTADREAAYHNLAHTAFGLGHYVPLTSAFEHPDTGHKFSVQEAVKDAEHREPGNPRHQEIIKQLGDSGELHKLAIMNMVLGNSDRHQGNYLYSNHYPGLHLIDHGLAFKHADIPTYLNDYYHAQHGVPGIPPQVHPSALKWALERDPRILERELTRHGAPPEIIKRTADRLRNVQAFAAEKLKTGQPAKYLDMHHRARVE